MIYVVHIVKEIKPLSCNWMDYVSLKKRKWRVLFHLVSVKNIEFVSVFINMSHILSVNLRLSNFWKWSKASHKEA